MAIKMIKTKKIFFDDNKTINTKSNNDNPIFNFVLLFSYGQLGQARLIGLIREDRIQSGQNLSFDDVAHTAIQDLGLTIQKVNWFIFIDSK